MRVSPGRRFAAQPLGDSRAKVRDVARERVRVVKLSDADGDAVDGLSFNMGVFDDRRLVYSHSSSRTHVLRPGQRRADHFFSEEAVFARCRRQWSRCR